MPRAFKRPAKTLWWVGGGGSNSELPQAGFPDRGKYICNLQYDYGRSITLLLLMTYTYITTEVLEDLLRE